MGTPHNPYLLQDVSTIIDTFIHPPIDEATGKPESSAGVSPGLDFRSRFLNIIADSSGWAKAADRLQNHIDKAKTAITTLYSYGTLQTGTKWTGDIGAVKGVEIQNTFYTAMQADNAGEALAAIAADCIPCEDRILALISLNPLEDLQAALDKMYVQSVGFLTDLYDLLLGDKSIGVFADFCGLFKFLSFMCVADLYRMVIVLSSLMKKYAFQLKDMTISFGSILGRMFGPSLQPLLSMLDKYIQLIIAPIDCIIDSLNAQIQKMDVVQAWDQATDRPHAADTPQIKELSAVMEGPLKQLRKYLEEAVDSTEETYDKLNKSIQDFLGIENAMDKQLFDLTYHMEMCARLIGVIQALILAVDQGAIVCGPEGAKTEDLDAFVNAYIVPQLDLDIVRTDSGVKVRPAIGSDTSDLMSSLGKLGLPANEIAQAFVPVSNCLYTTTDSELEAVKDMLSLIPEGGA